MYFWNQASLECTYTFDQHFSYTLTRRPKNGVTADAR